MASTFASVLTMILFTLFITGGQAQCTLENITVATERTSREMHGKQEWKVAFINDCECPQRILIVSCNGFQTVEPVDPHVFRPIGNNQCIVNGGIPVAPFGRVEFLYAWDPPFIFVPQSSEIHC